MSSSNPRTVLRIVWPNIISRRFRPLSASESSSITHGILSGWYRIAIARFADRADEASQSSARAKATMSSAQYCTARSISFCITRSGSFVLFCQAAASFASWIARRAISRSGRHQRPRVAPRLSRAERKGWPSGGRIRPPSRLSCPSPETDERRDGNISAVIFTRIHSVRIPWGPVTSLRGLPESYSFPEGENAGIALVPV